MKCGTCGSCYELKDLCTARSIKTVDTGWQIMELCRKCLSESFDSWLDKNCDYKTHFVGAVPMEICGKYYEGDHWHFVIEDHDDGETPAIVVTVGHEPESDYLEVRIENRDEMGNLEVQVGIGLFDEIKSLEALLQILVKENR